MSNPQIIEHRDTGGHLRVFFSSPGKKRRDVTMFRGVPVQINSMTSTDPFGDASAQITFPQISGFEKPGSGDLDWLVPFANVDIVFYEEDGTHSGWVWEGMLFSETPASTGTSFALKGALYQADNFVAAPWFPQYPVPYELLIKTLWTPSPTPPCARAP